MTVCKNCKGVGYIIVEDRYSTYFDECYECDGKGVVEPMTNEEYVRSCTSEQLAEFLADQCNEVVEFILNEVDEHAGNIEPDDYWYRQDVVAEWLKKPHKE